MKRATIRKTDMDRVLQAVKDAGEEIGGVEMKPDGTVVVLTGRAGAALTPLQQWRADRERGAA